MYILFNQVYSSQLKHLTDSHLGDLLTECGSIQRVVYSIVCKLDLLLYLVVCRL